MRLREEYRGEPPPDDPIEFHVWVEANECPTCKGSGIDPDSGFWELDPDDPDDMEFLDEYDCEDCDGTGYLPEAQPYV